MTELKPCPHCGRGTLMHNTNVVFVECKSCHASGPYMKTMQDAIAAWNALPRPLRWTKEPPTEPGYYWNHSKWYKTKQVVQVFEQFGKFYVFYPGSEVEEELSPDDEWAGPIQEPVN